VGGVGGSRQREAEREKGRQKPAEAERGRKDPAEGVRTGQR